MFRLTERGGRLTILDKPLVAAAGRAVFSVFAPAAKGLLLLANELTVRSTKPGCRRRPGPVILRWLPAF